VSQAVLKATKITKAPALNVAFKPFENSIYDIRGRLRLLDELTLIERALFRGKEGTISEKARDFTNDVAPALFEKIETAGLEPVGDAKQLSFIKELVGYLKGLPVANITLAFAPTNTFVENLSNQISTVVGVKTLIDLIVNEYIVGGAVIEFRGKVFRQTLDIPLEEVLRREVGVLTK